jgi:hypothetical protein
MTEESSVTIFIQGHGREMPSQPFAKVDGLSLLSFSGSPGELGEMNFCKNGEQIDVMAIKYIHKQYKNSSNNQENIYKKLPDGLRNLYEGCDIFYKNSGFITTYPHSQRVFYLKPNTHENCVKCVESGDNRCIFKRDLNTMYCPEYGITVVASTDPRDNGTTLATIDDRKKVNWSSSPAVMDHWYNRTDYNKNKYATKVYENLKLNKYIFLTELIYYFRYMGFGKIYILDPTCRYIDDNNKIPKLKMAAKTVMEQRKPQNKMPNVVPYSTHNVLPQSHTINRSLEPEPDNKNCTIKEEGGILQQCCSGICNIFNKPKIDGGKTHKRKKRKMNQTKLKTTTKMKSTKRKKTKRRLVKRKKQN